MSEHTPTRLSESELVKQRLTAAIFDPAMHRRMEALLNAKGVVESDSTRQDAAPLTWEQLLRINMAIYHDVARNAGPLLSSKQWTASGVLYQRDRCSEEATIPRVAPIQEKGATNLLFTQGQLANFSLGFEGGDAVDVILPTLAFLEERRKRILFIPIANSTWFKEDYDLIEQR